MMLRFPRIAQARQTAEEAAGAEEFEVALRVFRDLCTLTPAAATRVLIHVGEALEDRRNLRLVEEHGDGH